MQSLVTRRAMYISVAMAGVFAMALAGFGLVRAANNSQSADVNRVCDGVVVAQGILFDVLEQSDLSDDAVLEIEGIVALLDEVASLEEDGDHDAARDLKKEAYESLIEMGEGLADDADLSGTIFEAADELRRCIDRPVPSPQPEPHPTMGYVYSVKYVCGRDVQREAVEMKGLGKSPYLLNKDVYNTEINVHNFHGRRVRVSGQVLVARPIGQPQGRVSERMNTVLSPNEALQVNCRNIVAMLSPDDSDVCLGIAKAVELLERIQASDLSTSSEFSGRIAELIEMLHKAIRLEEQGEHDEALEIEREVVEHLNKLIELAKENDRTRLARALTEARNLVRRCIVQVDEADTAVDGLGISHRPLPNKGMVEGFLTIHTPVKLEVTGVYRAQSDSKTVAGGVGSGISIDVEQITPHRVHRLTTDSVDQNSQ